MAELVDRPAPGPVCVVHEAPKAAKGEARARAVTLLTFVMMVGELVWGWHTNSLGLISDGWHMATHVGALGLTGVAYWYARTRAHLTEFAFGTGKVFALAGFTSAGLLLAAAVVMGKEGIERLLTPEVVSFTEALPVAILGLVVNLLSVWLLGGAHEGHDHAAHDHHGHDHAHAHDHHDHNLRAAYLHVVADALTSVLAIAALAVGWKLGWWWADPVVALVGSAIIIKWGVALLRDCAAQLVDLDPSAKGRESVRKALEAVPGVAVCDLHLWRVGPGRTVCVVAVEAPVGVSLDALKGAVVAAVPVQHLTIEVRPRA